VSIETDVQKLTPGPILEFWELNATSIGGGILRFQGQQDGSVWWQGFEYLAFPVKGEGFERTGEQQPTPRVKVGNVERSITILCQALDDVVGATITRRRTFAKYLDAVNFYGPNLIEDALLPIVGLAVRKDGAILVGRVGGTSGVGLHVPTEPGKTYRLRFRLENMSALSRVGTVVNGVNLAASLIHSVGEIERSFTATSTSSYVSFAAAAIGVNGPAKISNLTVQEALGNPTADPTKEFAPELWFIERKANETPEFVEFELSSALDFLGVKLPRRQIIANQCPWSYRGPNCNYVGPPVADELDQPTSDPLLDKCGKRLSSCKLREWPDDVLNFGGFPAAGLVRT
jgi:phage-related protein